jgi:hypothetical protein
MANSTATSSPRFGWIVDGEAKGPRPPFDIDLFELKAAGVTPTVGAIVPGWVLIVPRVQAFCFAELAPAMLNNLRDDLVFLRQRMRAFGGRLFLFEHGARKCGSDIACGVDQAHAHLVALENDLLRFTLSASSENVWQPLDPVASWSAIDDHREYYYITDFKSAFVSYPTKSESQYFRRQVAAASGEASKWDYRVHPYERNAEQTIRVLTVQHAKSAA